MINHTAGDQPLAPTDATLTSDSKHRSPALAHLRDWFVYFFDWYSVLPTGHGRQKKGQTKPVKWSQRMTRWKENLYPSSDVIARMLIEQGYTVELVIKPPKGATTVLIRKGRHENRKGIHERKLEGKYAFLDMWEDQIVEVEEIVEGNGQFFYKVLKSSNSHLSPFNEEEVLIPAIEGIVLDEKTATKLRQERISETA